MLKRLSITLAVLSLAGLMINCGDDWLTGKDLDTDPNRATEVPSDNLLVGIQMNGYGIMEDLTFFESTWMQQMCGVDQHYAGYDVFDISELLFGTRWGDIYMGGGLQDIRELKRRASEDGRWVKVGIAKMWEALLISTAADLWGDVPYSEAGYAHGPDGIAGNDDDIEQPKYDAQSEVHAAVLDLLDSAIENFNTGETDPSFDGSFDFTYGGNVTKWIAAAHTLKARILLNWAEVKSGNYALALAEAADGITSEANNWKTQHSDVSGEENLWWQFEAYRYGYVKAGNYLVELLKTDKDPRLEIYFGLDDAGGYSGSKSGEEYGGASFLNEETFGSRGWDWDLVSAAEDQFIIAECQYAAGDEAAALAALDAAQTGLEARWSLEADTLLRHADSTGVGVLEAVMMEKYKAQFVRPQVWSDWRRTAFPIFDYVYKDRQIPRRYLYPDDELNTNRVNVEATGLLTLYDRVENDPGNPTYPGRTVNP